MAHAPGALEGQRAERARESRRSDRGRTKEESQTEDLSALLDRVEEAKADALSYRAVGKNALAAEIARLTRRCAALESEADGLRTRVFALEDEKADLAGRLAAQRSVFETALLADRVAYRERVEALERSGGVR